MIADNKVIYPPSGTGDQVRTRQYINPMGEVKCSASLSDTAACNADIPDCMKASMMVDWNGKWILLVK